VKTFICSNCNTVLRTETGKIHTCPACSSQHLDITEKAIDYKGLLTGNFVNKNEFLKSLQKELITGIYTPDDIIEETKIKQYIKIFIPHYHYEINYTGDWSASSGYDRLEEYTAYKTKYENGRSRPVPVQQTRTVTDWRPSNGNISGSTSFSCIASSIFKDENIINFIDDFDIDIKKSSDNKELNDAFVEKCSYSEKEIFDISGEDVLELHIRSEVRQQVPGDHIKNLQCTFQHEITDIILFYKPIWIALCNYKNNEFKFLSDGNNAEDILLSGEKPVDKERVKKVKSIFRLFKIILPLKITFILLTLFFFFLIPVSKVINISLSIATIFLVITFFITGIISIRKKNILLNKSKAARRKSLTRSDKNINIDNGAEITNDYSDGSPKSRAIALLLCFGLGFLGVHRFYVGKTGSGILYLLTGGIFGIGWLVDYILILSDNFEDDIFRYLKEW